MTTTNLSYDSSVFDVRTIAEAKAIILTDEDSTTEARWETETPYLGALINQHLGILPHHRVMDYGCGIGRLSKDLIDRTGCSVVGVDTSVSMRALATAYVGGDRFLSCSPDMLVHVQHCSYAIAVWTLQHIPNVDLALRMIQLSLRSFGQLFVVNMNHRALPVPGRKWTDDGEDMRDHLGKWFTEVSHGALDPLQTTPATAAGSFWGVYERRY